MLRTKNIRNIVAATALFLSFGMVSATAQGNFRPTGAPLTIEAMMKDYNVWGARISPDGKHIAALAGVPGQNPIVRVWDTDDMSKAPLQFGSRTMRFVNLSFIKNDRLFLGTAQPVEQGHNSDWIFSSAISNLDGSKIEAISNEAAENTRDEDRIINVTVFNRLPLDPENILVQVSKFSGTEIVKVNLRSGASRRYFRSGDNESVEWDDNQGVIRVKNRLDFSSGVYNVKYYLRLGENNWHELTGLQQSINDRYTLSVQHVSNDNKTIWVITDKDTNYAVLKKFDVATNTFSETFAQNTEFDLTSASFGSAADEYAQNHRRGNRTKCSNNLLFA
ncbi:MAG: peptidase S9 prolyl oligopeptidase active site domain-containing protein [Hyphomonadaceae bacterium]|nr:MAG: peptidase S9 prolyl oligopeptidase active site domain-containing protein [Hyphomonadaceae bacterium]